MSLPEVCVCYLLRLTDDGRQQVLLGRKKTGLGLGRLVGPGGKLEPGESAAQAAVREIAEEVGLTVDVGDLELMGELTYPFPHKPAWSQKSWVFRVHRWVGEPTESEELEPVWVDVAAIPFDQMWDDARYWLPATLAGNAVYATFQFGEDGRTVESSTHPAFGRA